MIGSRFGIAMVPLALFLLGHSAAGQESNAKIRTPSPPDGAVYFIDLQDGARISATTTIRFGLRNMGVAPAGTDKEHSGHHHLLIDTELLNLDEPIPNDPNHLHFGAGQTEAQVSLTPGDHILQLVLADKEHRPHDPPVASERVRVTVIDAAAVSDEPSIRKAVGRHPAPSDAKVYIISPPNGAEVSRTFRVRFGLLNMGVAPAGVEKAGTGHHHLIIDTVLPAFDVPIPNNSNHLHFGSGQTEARISLPPGEHTLQLLMADENHVAHDPPIFSSVVKVKVVESRATRTRRPRTR